MKNKISAVILGVAGLFVCAGFGLAEDGDLLAFDNVHKNPRGTVSRNGENIVLPEVSKEAVKQDGSGTSVQQPAQLVVMKELLKDLSAEDRAEMLNSMVLKNGRVVSVSLAPLRKTLTSEKVDSVVKTIFYHPEQSAKGSQKKKSPARYTEIAKLFKDVPPAVRNEFLDNLTFKNGSFVSAYIGGLRSAVQPARMDEIIGAIATTSGPRGAFGPKSLCLGGVCYDAVCQGDGEGEHKCLSDKNSACDTTCQDTN